MNSWTVNRKPPGTFGLWMALTISLTGVTANPSAQASEEEFQYDERLMPLARTYLDLHLCANVAGSYDDDHAVADRYISRARVVSDRAKALSWTSTDFASALVIAFEEKEALEVREDDTPESYNRRHYSGDRCADALSTRIDLQPRQTR